MAQIEIGGELYEQRPQSSSRNLNRGMVTVLAMASMFGGLPYGRPAPQVNLIEEYTLILQKKSKLSKRDRDWVVNQFNRTFKKVAVKS